jgi:hypothetical protein
MARASDFPEVRARSGERLEASGKPFLTLVILVAVKGGVDHRPSMGKRTEDGGDGPRTCPMPAPSLKIVLTGTQYGYRREDGVLVVPIGCLRD